MKGQISRDSHRPDRRYSGVYQIQGGMVTDADLDERSDIVKGRTDALGADAIRDGVPVAGGVVVVSESNVALGEGIVYADGVRGVLAASAGATLSGPLDIFGQQADLPLGPALPVAAQIVYADVWERPVFALEDPYLADPGLHGAETAYRSRTMTQIKSAPLGAAPAIENGTGDFPQIGDAVLAVAPHDPESTIDECDPCAEVVTAEQTVANALFRLEVVAVEGTPRAPTGVHLAWSAENGAAIAPATVSPEAFERAGRVYEFFSEITESYMGAFADPANVRRSAFVDDLEATPSPPQNHDGSDWPLVRRWDGHAIVDIGAGTVAAKLGSGTIGFDGTTVTLGLDTFDAQLTLAGHRVLRGDYWLVELRTFADPASRLRLVQATPVGILHHYCLLVRTRRGVIQPLTDAERRRLSFPPLSDLPASHVGFVNNCPKLYAGAENVQDALDELCAISAEDVGFDPSNCPSLYDEAKTVQEALDRLCTVERGGCCRIVVGPQGSGQPALNDLLAAHNQSGEPLCVCLLPGDHLLEAPVDNPKLAIDIEGCSAGTTRIRVAGNWKVDAASLRLADTSVLLAGNTGLQVSVRDRFELDNALLASVTKETPLLSVSAGERIRISDTTLEAMASSAMADLFRFFEEGTHGDLPDQDLFELREHDRFEAAVDDLADKVAGMSDAARGTYRSELFDFLAGAERLTLLERFGIEQLILHCERDAPASTYRADFLRLRHAAAFSRPAPALVIETAVAQTLIESSEIRGVLSFYGPPADNPLVRDEARALSQVLRRIQISATHRSLHVMGNRLARIAVGQETVEQVRRLPQAGGAQFSDIFRQAFLSNNAIECDANAFIAAAHHLADLRFLNQEGQREFLGYVVGKHAAYTGLSCEITSINGVPELYDLTGQSDRAVLVALGVVP